MRLVIKVVINEQVLINAVTSFAVFKLRPKTPEWYLSQIFFQDANAIRHSRMFPSLLNVICEWRKRTGRIVEMQCIAIAIFAE